MKKIALLGSTGSIGTQVLNVVRRHPDKYKIVSLAAGGNAALLAEQIKEFKPLTATCARYDQEFAGINGVETFFGEDSYTNAIIGDADVVVVALVGFKGMSAVLDAIEKGKNVALANKESLVVGGKIITERAREKGVSIVPIDSEHSAIWQALDFDFTKPFRRLILTASGGAFRDYDVAALKSVTAKDALKHPNWNMGAKITVDCATMVNKALEVAEAKWLYNTTFDKIEVIIHRESIIHSMVEYEDSSVIAQMSYPTMELPIQTALSYPDRFFSGVRSLDLASVGKLTFEALDDKKYPCFGLVLNAEKKGGVYAAVANGANESAVRLFLENKIAYGDIYSLIAGALDKFDGDTAESIATLNSANDFAARFVAEKYKHL